MDDWVGRGAVVLGANSSPGLKITKKLLDMGMKVVGIDEEVEAVKVNVIILLYYENFNFNWILFDYRS